MIMKSKDELALGYEVHINGRLNEITKERIVKIAESYSLKIAENNGLIIYESIA